GTGSFGGATNFALGGRPQKIAIGDFNGDGKQDLASANNNNSTVSVLLGNGSGGFGAFTNFAAGTNTLAVAIGDFNGDGNQDIAAANLSSSNVSLLLGNGAGGFAAAAHLSVPGGPQSVAVGDFNADGKQDLAFASQGSDKATVLLRQCPPDVPINDVTAAEGDAGMTAFTFTVSVSSASAGDVVVSYSTADGTINPATGGSDYTAIVGGSVTIPASATSAGLTVQVTGDTAFEPNETFFVMLTSATSAVIADSQGTGTITNDDSIPVTLIVTKTADTDDGFCTSDDCSLREAIGAANANADASTISFNVPASDPGFVGGVFTIRPASSLPSITNPATIDGVTQTAFTG